MQSLKTANGTNSIQRNSSEVSAPATLSVTELFERRDKAIAEATMYQRIIDRETLRLAKREKDVKRWESKDWTTRYTGQKGRILSAIWHAPKRRLTTDKIEVAGWGIKKQIVSKNTLETALKRIRKKLKDDKCPYILTPIRSRKTGEIIGHKLRKHRIVQKVQK